MVNQPTQNIKFNEPEQQRLDLLEKRLNNFISEIDFASKELKGLKLESESVKKENAYLTEQNDRIKDEVEALNKKNIELKDTLLENQKNLDLTLQEDRKIKDNQIKEQSILDINKKELLIENKKIESDRELLNKQQIKFAQDNALFQEKYKALSDAVNQWK